MRGVHIVGPENRGFLKARAMCGEIVMGPQVSKSSVGYDDREQGTCPGCRAAAGLPLAEDADVEVRGVLARGVMPAGHTWDWSNGKRYVSTGLGEEVHCSTWMPELNQWMGRVGEVLPDDPKHAVVTFCDRREKTFTLTYVTRVR